MLTQPIPLAEPAGEVVELFEFVAEEKHITVTTTTDLHCTADRNRLQQVLVNRSTTLRTPDGGRVELMRRRHAETIICVDTGAGIPAQETTHLGAALPR